MKGHMPRLDSLIQIAKTLEIDFHIDPTRSAEVSADICRSLGLPTGTTLKEAKGKIERLTGKVATSTEIIQEIRAVQDAVINLHNSPTRQVEVRELAAAAGGGATELDETVTGYVSFQRSWLDRHGLDATQCTVINIVGESMEPTLPDGSKILVDLAHHRRRQGRIYLVRTSEGLVVKRAGKTKDNMWLLVSDHKDWKPMTWGDSKIIGEVKWVGRTL